ICQVDAGQHSSRKVQSVEVEDDHPRIGVKAHYIAGEGREGSLYVSCGCERQRGAVPAAHAHHPLATRVLCLRCAVAYEMHEDPGCIWGGLLRGVLNDLFQVEDATDAYVFVLGAEAFECLVESIGDLTAPCEAVGAGGV